MTTNDLRVLINNELQSSNVVYINDESVKYNSEIKQHRNVNKVTGDKELVRAFLIHRLVNHLDYNPERIEIEKGYEIKGGRGKLQPRIDLIINDDNDKPFFFIEIKSPDCYEKDKLEIEGQLFSLAQAEENLTGNRTKYLVYYTLDIQDDKLLDKAIIIDYGKYRSYSEWEEDGFISIGTELTSNYGQPKKQPLIKGSELYDLREKINREEIEGLARNLHNVLWGGGGTNDSEIFYSLVNIILAKIQDEYETEDGIEYDFQIFQYENGRESSKQVFKRINDLYKRALREQLNVTGKQDDNIINRNKFPLNKLVYTVQTLERFSFLNGRSSLDGKDILGDFFESITRDGFKQSKGQFFTPTPIVKFLLYAIKLDDLAINRLNSVRELPLIIDPSAGSGTYLVEAMKLITKELKYKQNSRLKSNELIRIKTQELFKPDNNENRWAREYLYGAEINFDLGTATKVNMILHGDGSANIFVKDGLLPFSHYEKASSTINQLVNSKADPFYNGKEVNEKFDVVISNPPFSVDLDTQTKKDVKKVFAFGDKKNSENLFIERYYQLLKENGRLGVVLPESVFDTTENKYIRLFLYKYFKIKAIVSLPQITFQPHTSVKTSILIAQKKTKSEVEDWNTKWTQFSKEWSFLKTRVEKYIKYYVKGEKLNNKWAKDVVNDIKNNYLYEIKRNIKRYLKDYLVPLDDELTVKELLEKYEEEIESINKKDKEKDMFGHCNTWWVFSEVSKELDYDVFMAEAENVGYKKTKRGENPMPNDLFDLEYAPSKIIIGNQDDPEIVELLNRYYINGTLKEEFTERTDTDLIDHFKNGKLSQYNSSDIVLREKVQVKILDQIRQEVKWD